MKKLFLLGLLAVSLIGCTSASTGTAKNGDEYLIEKGAIKLHRAIEEGQYEVVSTDELKAWIDEGKDMVVVDTMPAGFYAKGHIPGARNYELSSKEAYEITDERLKEFDKVLGGDRDKTLVIYCGYTSCGRGHSGMMNAKKLGYKNIYRYPGGIIAWKDAKLNVEK